MTNIFYNISQVLGAGILHSLWQGMLVYVALRIVFAAAPDLSSLKRYNLGVLGMLAVLALFVYTVASQAANFNWNTTQAVPAGVLPQLNLHLQGYFTPEYLSKLSPYMPYICAVYMAGLLANFIKLGAEWNKIRLIKQTAVAGGQMQQLIGRFSQKLGLSKAIGLKFSAMIDVPCVVGYLKPIILLPVSLSTQLTACEIESILLHELAHIKRNDYLLNLLQQVVSVMLFFNPFSRLINRVINQERENSCDDLVVAKTGKPLIYAQALLKLETARTADLKLALAATGKKFYLFKRIERIMKTKQETRNMRHIFLAVLLLAGGLCSIAWFSPVYAKIKAGKTGKTAYAATVAADTTDEYANMADTGKHKKKSTKTLYKKHTVKKSHDSVVYNDDDTSGYFHSQEWKNQMAEIQKQSEELKKQFNSPEWKEQQEHWKKMGEEMKKQFNSPEWKKQQEHWKEQALAMQKQFNGPEWKAQQEQWKKMGEEWKKQFDSQEWKNQQEQWKKMAEDMKKQFDGPEWKAQQEQWKKMGEQMKKQFDSPEWKEQWKKQSELMKKQFNSPEWKQQMEEMKKMGEQMKKQFDSKEWKDAFKNQKWKMTDSVGGVDIYKPAPKDTVKQ